MPREPDLDVIRLAHFAAKNMRHALVDLGERNRGLALRDSRREFIYLKGQRLCLIVRPLGEQLLGDSFEEVA